jgi:hypothetical protein
MLNKILLIPIVVISLTTLTYCSGSNSGQTNPAPDLAVDDGLVSISALISSGGLSISSNNPDILNNTINLGTASTSQSILEKQITIKNDSSNNISLNISIDDGPTKITINRCSSSLASNHSCIITVRFSPRALYNGEYPNILQINSDPSLSFVIKAKVENNPTPTEGAIDLGVEYSPFSESPFTTTPIRKEIVLENKSNSSIASAGSLAPILSGSNSSVYQVWINRCSSPLFPRKKCSIFITTTRAIRNFSAFPQADVTFGGTGTVKLSCNSSETFNIVSNECLDITAPTLPLITLDFVYPSDISLLKFKVSHCDDIDKILYKEDISTPSVGDSSWATCNINTSYSHDLSLKYIFPNHLRTIYYWVKDASNNLSPMGSFAVQYYPESLVIQNKLAGDKIHISQVNDFLSSGGVLPTFFSFDNGTQSFNNATITDSGHFVPNVNALGPITINLRDSKSPTNHQQSYSFQLYQCTGTQSFNSSLNNCFDNQISCTSDIAHATSASKNWNNTNSVYSSCTLSSCEAGYSSLSNLCSQDNYLITINQPRGGGITAAPSSVTYGQSSVITYVPPTGFELNNWSDDCAQAVGNTCTLTNIQSNKVASAAVQCKSGYIPVGQTCVLSTYTLTLNQPTGNGLSATKTTINYNDSTVISYTPPSGYKFMSWTGDCAGILTAQCTLSNIQADKTVGAVIELLPYSISLSYANNAQMQMDICVKNTATVKTVSGSNISSSTTTTIPISADTGVGVYSNSSCSTALTQISLSAGQSTKDLYIKNSNDTQASQSIYFDLTSYIPSKSQNQIYSYSRPSSCLDAKNRSQLNTNSQTVATGTYTIGSNNYSPKKRSVYCDQDTDGGGWTMIGSGWIDGQAPSDPEIVNKDRFLDDSASPSYIAFSEFRLYCARDGAVINVKKVLSFSTNDLSAPSSQGYAVGLSGDTMSSARADWQGTYSEKHYFFGAGERYILRPGEIHCGVNYQNYGFGSQLGKEGRIFLR